jgi:hypothetical protein
MSWRAHCGSVPQRIWTRQNGEQAVQDLTRRCVGDGAWREFPLAGFGAQNARQAQLMGELGLEPCGPAALSLNRAPGLSRSAGLAHPTGRAIMT